MDFDFLGIARRPHLTPWAAVVFWSVIAVLLAFIGWCLWTAPTSTWPLVMYRASVKQDVTELTPAVDSKFVQDSFHAATSFSIPKQTRILLIPHHLVAAREIAGVLSSVPAPKRIVLLAPDHLGVGRTPATVGDGALAFDQRAVKADVRTADLIVSADDRIRINNGAISRELSMQALMPFLAEAFPNTVVTPVLMQIGRDQDVRASLSGVITELLKKDPNTLLISTVDFSHYLPADVADFHDEFAQDVIKGLADLETDRVELDSAGVLAVTLHVARELGLGNVSMLAHTNSLRILDSKLSQESTSHIIASFSPGPVQKQQELSMLFFGDMMFDREVKNRIAKSQDPLFPFRELMGKEERVFRGQDMIMANLEGPVTSPYRAPEKENDFAFDAETASLLKRVGITIVSQANNHTLDQGREGALDSRANLEKQGVAWVGDQVQQDSRISLKQFSTRGQTVSILAFNAVGISLDRDAMAEAFRLASTSSYRVVYMHWGNEYEAKPSANQTELAHWLIDQGADAVIGAHPHWMQGIETYKHKPIVYSLGNAIFDQDWSIETQYGLSVGLVLSATGSKMYLFPLQILKSVPRMLSADLRQSRLDHLAEISDPSLSEQIEKGFVSIP